MIGELAYGLLTCLRHFYFHNGKAFLGISPTSVLYSYKKRKFTCTMSLNIKLGLVRKHFKETNNIEDSLAYFKTLRKRFWMDLFGIGILILNCIVGNTLDDINRLLGFSLSDLYQLTSFSSIPERCQEFCCLFHYIEEILLADEQTYISNYYSYQRIYEIANVESLFTAIKKIKQVPKLLKDFLCNLTHLDFKNPSDFADVLSHPYLKDCKTDEESLKHGGTNRGQPRLLDIARMIRINARSAAGSYFFEGIIKDIEQMHNDDLIFLTSETFEDKIKKLGRELAVDKSAVYSFFKDRIVIDGKYPKTVKKGLPDHSSRNKPSFL